MGKLRSGMLRGDASDQEIRDLHADLMADDDDDTVSAHLPGQHDQSTHGRGGIRDVLKNAKTTSEVSSAISGELKRITGRTIPVDLAGHDPQVAREHGEGLLRVAERYPKARVARVVSYGPGGAIVGQEGYERVYAYNSPDTAVREGKKYYQYSTIAFNNQWASPSQRQTYYRLGVFDETVRHSVRGAGGPVGVAVHEYGHSVAFAGRGRDVAQAAADKSAPRGVTTSDHVRVHISTYAATNRDELSAEAISDVVMNGRDASPLSHRVVDAIDAEYRRVFPEQP